ncbi:F-actin-uncapping protein LRRC16A-like [Amphiura filiformis]|uniref:F-actin-uncapping protein LRRC16A-like n=1 Tax=Amphiura filiformis TaxID=82378 RepID=UPI003B20F11A
MSSSGGPEEIPPEVVAGIEQCLGERVQHGPMYVVRVEGRQQRLDSKVMVLSPHRMFLMAQRSNTKIDFEFNYLEVHTLENTKPLQLQFHLAYPSNKSIKMTTVKPEDTRSIIEYILMSLRKTFPQTCLDKMIPKICIQPPERSTSIHNAIDRMTIPEQGPCGGFTQMYQCMCDLHGEAYQPEVAWDVDTIYLSQDSKELCLNDFDHLESRDLVPIVASLMYNSWFTKLTATNLKLSSDTSKEIKKVMTKSSSIEYLVLDNVGIRWDFAKELSTALLANTNTALRHIDLSNNLLDDRGIKHLSGEISKLPNGLVTLRLSKIGMTAESTVQLGKALLENNFMPTSLLSLDLSGNAYKDGDINNLTQFLATPNAITHLNLSDTEIPLDSIFNALYRGCCANLSHLTLSGNTFSYRRNAAVPQTFKQYFATTQALKVLNLSRNKLPPDVVKEVILGIGSNVNLTDVELDLSSNELKVEGGRVVESCIANVPNIAKLNLSDNDLSTSVASLLDWISQNQVITSLDISQNLTSLRPGAKTMMKVIDAIVTFIQNEDTALTSLSVAGNKLKFETIQIINALGSNTTLTSVDLSGNGMGDIGARMLAKALMINTKLNTVSLDNNAITAKGFADIADALERNYTLKYMPTPVNDVSQALRSDANKTQAALQKIQTLLQRNHSPHKFSDDQAFRLQQGFLYTTSHQLVDQLVVQIQDTSKDLADCSKEEVQADINTAKDIIADADNSKQLLAILHKVALDSEDSKMMEKLEEIVTHVQDTARTRLESNVNGMLEGANEHCSHMMKDTELKMEIESLCQEKKQLPERFMQDVMEQVSAAIFNRISQANLAVASIISDTIIDEIIEQLTEYQEKLAAHAVEYGSGKASFCNSKAAKSGEITVNGEKETTDEDAEKKDEKREQEKEELGKLLKPKEEDGLLKPKSKKEGGRKVRRNPTQRMVLEKRRSVKVRPRSSVVRRGEYRIIRLFHLDTTGHLTAFLIG